MVEDSLRKMAMRQPEIKNFVFNELQLINQQLSLAMKEMNVAPEHTLYVGDSDVDIETARNAGMKCISVSWGFRDEAFLLKHGAEHIIKRPLDFLSYI